MPELNFCPVRIEVLKDCPVLFSKFVSVTSTKPEKTISLEEMIDEISGGEYSEKIAKVRTCQNDNERRELKKKLLPAYTISGVFKVRNADSIKEHSGLIAMDFDAKDNPVLGNSSIKEELGKDQFVRVVFHSASGVGLCLICRIEGERHTEAFDALREYFRREYGIEADSSGRDVSRLRFTSWDTDLIENELARVFRRYSYSTDRPDQSDQADHTETLSSERRTEIAQALAYISPDNRDQWLEIGMAIRSENSHMDGYNLWKEWSELNDTASKFDESDCLRVWKSFQSYSGRKVEIETLFKRAYDAGWKGKEKIERSNELPLISMADWSLMPEKSFLPIIDGVCGAGDKGDILAPSKCRKSFFAFQLALFLSIGREFLGFEVPCPKKTLYAQFEIKADWMQRRAKSMVNSLNVPLDLQEKLTISNCRGFDLKHITFKLHQTVLAKGYEVLIVDPLYKILLGDENSARDIKPTLNDFDKIAEDTGATLFVVHHDAKGIAGDRNIRDRGAGSGVTGRDCDFRLTLTPQHEKEDDTVLGVMSRNFKPIDDRVIRFMGSHFIEVDEKPDPTTTKRKNKTDPRSLLELSERACEFFKDGPISMSVFQEDYLKEGLNLSRRNATALRNYMMDKQYILKSRQIRGGYFVGTQKQIEELDKGEI